MTGLYVINAAGKPLLRQVRVGKTTSNGTEILSGISAGERVTLDPQAAWETALSGDSSIFRNSSFRE